MTELIWNLPCFQPVVKFFSELATKLPNEHNWKAILKPPEQSDRVQAWSTTGKGSKSCRLTIDFCPVIYLSDFSPILFVSVLTPNKFYVRVAGSLKKSGGCPNQTQDLAVMNQLLTTRMHPLPSGPKTGLVRFATYWHNTKLPDQLRRPNEASVTRPKNSSGSFLDA